MAASRTSERGFSLNELMLVIAVSGTMMAIALPVMTDLGESTKLSSAARELERELQSARLKAVTSNQILRVRLNCPAAGYYRTVEVLNNAEDSATNRCLLSVYPFPAGDTDLTTVPNHDGPLRMLPDGATVTGDVLEFHPDGTAFRLISNVVTTITSPVTITVTRKGKSKAMTINGAGKIQLQQ